LRALEAVWSVTRGQLVVGEVVNTELEDKGADGAMKFYGSADKYSGWIWWSPTTSALAQMIRLARFPRCPRPLGSR
jgi:hypothetical protein